MTHESASTSSMLPIVVQVGFAGSRRLFENPTQDPQTEQQWLETVRQHLQSSLQEFKEKLQFSPMHFLCGISQIACGADTLFTQLCEKNRIPQRIFLPQPLDLYLAASGSTEPDFTPEQQAEARSLVDGKQIIQQRVVSQSTERSERFRDANAEILRVSDVVVCLELDRAEGKAGGTSELARRAIEIGTPVLVIRVSVEDGQPVCRNQWHLDPARPFRTPSIPNELRQLSLPEPQGQLPGSQQYCATLKELVSTQAKREQ